MPTNWPTIILRDDILIPGKKPFINAIQLYYNIAPMPTPILQPFPRSKKFNHIKSKFMNLYSKK